MLRLYKCCVQSFFERFVLFFCLKIERFVPETTEIWICGLYPVKVTLIRIKDIMYSSIDLHGYAFIQIEIITGFQIQFKEIRCIHSNVLINKTCFMFYHHTTGISTG